MIINTFNNFFSFLETNYTTRIAFRWFNQTRDKVLSKTYYEFVRDVRNCAAVLSAKVPQIEKKHIGLLCENSYDSAVGIFGAFLSGAVVVPLNNKEIFNVIQEQIGLTDIDCILHDGSYLALRPEFERYETLCLDVCLYKNCSMQCLENDCENPESPAAFFLTSGTTGKSKAVMMSRKIMLTSLLAPLAVMQKTEAHRIAYYLLNPLYHISGFGACLVQLAMGNEIDICCNMKYLYQDLETFQSEMTSTVPMVIKMWAKDLSHGWKSKLANLHSIAVGSATMPSEVVEIFQKNGISVYQGYGMTEIFGGSIVNYYTNPEKADSVGLPVGELQVKCIKGEICIKSKGLMIGYYKNPIETQKIMQDGWLHTGDLGYIDNDGYVYLTGRKKNLIILSSGENVSPEELERLIMHSDAVLEVLVKEKDNKICAEIFCDKASQPNVKNYMDELNRTLPMYKRITLVEFRTEPFPRTANGKIKRYGGNTE